MNQSSSTSLRKVTHPAFDNKGQQNTHQVLSAHIDPLTKEHCVEITVVCVNKNRLPEMLIPDGLGDLSFSSREEDIALMMAIYQGITDHTKDNPSTRALDNRSFSKAITFQYKYDSDTFKIYESAIQPTLARFSHTEFYYSAQKTLNSYSYGSKPLIVEVHDFARAQKQLATGQDLSGYKMPVQEVMHQIGALAQRTGSAKALEMGINCLHRTKIEDTPFINTQDAIRYNIKDISAPLTTTKHPEHSLINFAIGTYLHEGINILTENESRALAIGASAKALQKLKVV